MKKECILTKKILIPNEELGRNINNMVQTKAQQEFLNKVIPDLGIIENIIEIILCDHLGEIVNTGVKFTVELKCTIYFLEVNEIIKAKVNNMTNIGIFANDCDNIMANIFIPSDQNQCQEQYVNVNIQAVRINDIEVTAIGSII